MTIDDVTKYAASLYNVPVDQVTPEMRKTAKTLRHWYHYSSVYTTSSGRFSARLPDMIEVDQHMKAVLRLVKEGYRYEYLTHSFEHPTENRPHPLSVPELLAFGQCLHLGLIENQLNQITLTKTGHQVLERAR